MPTAPINGATATQFTPVAAVAGKRIRVLSFFMSAAGAQTFKWQSANNDLMPAMSMATGVNIAIGPFFDGVFDCNVGEALNFTLSAAQQVSGMVQYTLISG